MRFRTLRTPLAVLAGLVVVVAGATTALLAYRSVRTVHSDQLDRLLQVMAGGAFSLVEEEAGSRSIEERMERVVESPWKGTGVEFRVWTDEGRTLASSSDSESFEASARERPPAGARLLFDHADGKKTYRCLWERRGNVNVLLAHPSSYETRRLREIAIRSSAATALVVAVALAAAAWGAALVLRPLRRAATIVESGSPASELEREAATAPRELAPVLRAVRGRLERQERFASDVAHELRTPLAVAQSTLQLSASSGSASKEDLLRAMAATVEDLRRMERVIDELTLLSRLEGSDDLPERRKLRLDALLRRVVEREQERDGTVIDVAALPEIELDGREDLLERLFANLLENATRYGPAGRPVRVELAVGPDSCSTSIEDEGGDVPQVDLERMFERFYRGRGSSAARGTGLGLAIARQIARRHGGDVTVQVVPGTRTRFVVSLSLRGRA